MSSTECCQCKARGHTSNLYGYDFCDRCQTKLGLHTDKTILKNADAFDGSEFSQYDEKVAHQLQTMEKDFIKKKVKLLHILDRLDALR